MYTLRNYRQGWHDVYRRHISVIYIGYISDILEFENIGYFRYVQKWIFSIFCNTALLLDVKTSLKCENRHFKSSIRYCLLFNFKTFNIFDIFENIVTFSVPDYRCGMFSYLLAVGNYCKCCLGYMVGKSSSPDGIMARLASIFSGRSPQYRNQ